jgi:hypothetical protein
MLLAIEQALEGRKEGNPPVGSIIVKDGNIISRGRNRANSDLDLTAHAELDAIRKVDPKLYLQRIGYKARQYYIEWIQIADYSVVLGLLFLSRPTQHVQLDLNPNWLCYDPWI